MSLLPFELPPAFLTRASRGPEWTAWVDGVPRMVRDLLDEWDVAVDGAPTAGRTSLVVPVRTDGRAAVLKVAPPREENRHEILGLQHWHGDGAVQMLRADPRRNAMLLERLSTRDLTQVRVTDACEVIAGLYARLHVPAPPQLLTLSSYVGRWFDDLARLPRDAALPRRIVEQAVRLGRDLADDPATDGTLIHGDLHYGNVLAGDRQPWLAIDPKPVSGDPHYELAPVLANRWDEIVAAADVRRAVRRRFHTVVDIAGLDEERARNWVIVREAHHAMWAIEGDDAERITTAIAIIKAVQD